MQQVDTPSQTTATVAAAEPLRQILLATPRGFCAGVERAITIVERALEKYGAPVHVRHEVVHNRFVVERLRRLGAIFIENLAEVPSGAVLVFSAHGVPLAVREEAAQRGFTLFDATCPLVTKVHLEIQRLHAQGYEIVMIGHRGHPEVEGTLGQVSGRTHLVESAADVERLQVQDPTQLAYVTQTTLSLDDTRQIIGALLQRFPALVGPRKADICYATQNRQDAVKQLSQVVDVVVVVGSPNSSNSNRLREVATHAGRPAYLIDRAEELRPEWFTHQARIGVTAGASAPEVLVEAVLAQLKAWQHTEVCVLPGLQENIHFSLPRTLENMGQKNMGQDTVS